MKKKVKRLKDRYDRHFQDHILACAVRVPEAANFACALLKPESFNDSRRQDAFRLLKKCWDENRELPSRAFIEHTLKDDEVTERLFREDVGDWKSTFADVIEFARRAEVAQAVVASARKIAEGDLEGLLERITKAVQTGQNLKDDKVLSLKDSLDEFVSEYLDPDRIDDTVVPSGLKLVDAQMGGGLRPGELACFMGDKKAGKTTLLVNVGRGALLSGRRVLHVTLELSDKRTMKRYHRCLAGGVSPLLDTTTNEEGEREEATNEALAKFVRTLRKYVSRVTKDLHIVRFADGEMAVSDLRALIDRETTRGCKPDVVLVDYLTCIRAERHHKDAVRIQIADITRDLRAIAVNYGVPVWTACQSNRAGASWTSAKAENEDGTKAKRQQHIITAVHTGESYAIPQIVDALWTVTRTPSDMSRGHAVLFADSLRDHASGALIDCEFDTACCRVTTLGYVDNGDKHNKRPTGSEEDKLDSMKEKGTKRKHKHEMEMET